MDAGILQPPTRDAISDAFEAANETVKTLEATRNLVALFDAFGSLSGLGSPSLCMHDHDGLIVKTLRMWAADNGRRIDVVTLTIEGDRTWECVKCGGISVHDSTSTRPHVIEDEVGAWSPAQAVQS